MVRSPSRHIGSSFLTFLLLSMLFPGACRTADPRGPAMGEDYFRREFSCTRGPVKAEQNPGFLLAYETYRKNFFQQGTPPAPGGIVIAGDSTVALFTPDRLQKWIPHHRVENRGVFGDTTVLLTLRLGEDILSLRPRILILAIGGNDILGGRCVTEAIARTEQILDTIHRELPKTKIVLVGIPPVNSWKANSISPFYDRKLEYLTQSRNYVTYMDLWNILGDPDNPRLNPDYRLVLSDGRVDSVHFNEKGYEAWGKELDRLLNGLLDH